MQDGGITALHLAAKNGHFKICRLIIANVNDKNPGDVNGVTPLHRAVEFGHVDVCKLIIDNVMDKNPSNIAGFTPLFYNFLALFQREPKLIHSLRICKLIISRNPWANDLIAKLVFIFAIGIYFSIILIMILFISLIADQPDCFGILINVSTLHILLFFFFVLPIRILNFLFNL